MGLWDSISYDNEETAKTGNPYLDDMDKGIELIARLLRGDNSAEERSKRYRLSRVDDIIDNQLLRSLDRISLENELSLYDKLCQLTDKLMEQDKMSALRNKTIVGVGGKFSSGKSCFLNSLLGSKMVLPEDQDETTSIPTYIVKSDKISKYACTAYNSRVELDDDAVMAMSHAFKNYYEFGFAGYVNNIVIGSPGLKYENIALLDTPGYSKDDSNVIKKLSDAQKAHEQLKTVDYLIWLIDVENGTVQQNDIEFIESLQISVPILIVLNKADTKPESELRSIIQESEQILRGTGFNIVDIIAYDSHEVKEYFGGSKLKDFLKTANEHRKSENSIAHEINKTINDIKAQIDKQKKENAQKKIEIRETIFRTIDSTSIRSLSEIYSVIKEEERNIQRSEAKIKSIENKINNLFDDLEMKK